ncbi:branched-chain amino acid transport system II carrier protein [Oscillibacter sp.]|uniref:branched-chain amino acid transport system II carrier protein n=1 Tax=Oscillibacter sp. TaxID=1945593 RepID=UPI0026075D67|nr:branched-chain amino acid transport system II carrier protein [Oscillibacter sp.]MDD3347047.1 branched-chain amino acid transport system II carrier protein [Oscillibacter sp.]
MQHQRKDMFVIGFALFSMFFGAGNVIFPPYLGLGCGRQWVLGFLCYYLADIGLALAALFAILRSGSSDGITRPIGRIPSTVLMSAIVLCIGPMLAIPRTAATTYEMSVAPLVSGLSPVWFSVLFFALILLLCLNESAVVDIVGKVLTPALLLGLLVLIVKGVIDPIGPVPAHILVENVPRTGIEAGYQTMDVLAALVFGIILLDSAREKGHTDPKAQFRVVAGAGVVAGVALLVVYLGLTYLGVTTSCFFDLTVLRTFLMTSIVRNLLGSGGIVLFSIVVALACITTAVALVSSAAAYFAHLSGERIPYRLLVILISVFSAEVSNFGLEQIVAIAGPILDIVYPPTLVLIALAFLHRWIPNDWVYRFAVLGALAFSLLSVLKGRGMPMDFLERLPLASYGFGWVVPAAVCGAVGLLFGHRDAERA